MPNSSSLGPNQQPDLVGQHGAAVGPNGLSYSENFLTCEEEVTLLAQLTEVPVSPFRFQGWLGKRQTASFGWHYDFDKASFGVADPIPAFLRPFRERAALFANLNPSDLVQALVIRYDPGAGIGWHRDRPIFEHVIGISLEAPATLRLRRRLTKGFERASIDLARRSIYHLSDEARHDWEHSIADMTVRRWSITFRSFSEKGLREISQ
jgi:alkylated DNA repair dioxygenase AlkB